MKRVANANANANAVAALAIATLAGVAIAALAACSSDATHVFSARRFDANLMCLDPYTAVDVVSGGDTGRGCDLVCLTNAGEHFVTRQCAPYPPLFGVYGADGGEATCAAALAAYARGDTCSDGGVVHGDGGADARDASDANDGGAGDASDAGDVSTE